MNELSQIFAQGDAELRRTAGEEATLCRRVGGERVPVRVVLTVAEVGYTLQRANGPVVTCERVGLISRAEAVRAPQVGDTLDTDEGVYEVLRVTGWAYDTSWHCDLAVRKRK